MDGPCAPPPARWPAITEHMPRVITRRRRGRRARRAAAWVTDGGSPHQTFFLLSAVLIPSDAHAEAAEMPLDDSSITRFLQTFPGEVLRPADPGFTEARAAAIWNGAITHEPALIVRPTSTEEVAATLALARETGTDVTVRGGGHSAAGSCVQPGAVMVDLSRMNGVRLDSEARRAHVDGGASWAAVDAATAPHGL